MSPRASTVFTLLTLSSVPLRCPAEVTVNAAQAITHSVVVQPIITRKTSGTTAAFMGNVVQEAYIKLQINRIWAQTGVRIDWLPPVSYVSDFAYDGSPGNYNTASRPSAHLDQLINNTPSPPKSGNPAVVNMFVVEIVPGFSKLSDDYSNGFAGLDRNGIAVHAGTNLLTWAAGMDLVASVFAHEIGHNLGLPHTTSGTDNLMSSSASSQRLTAAQKTTIFTNNGGADGFDLLQPATSSSNYLQWALSIGLTGGPTADPDRDGVANVLEFMLGTNPNVFSQLPEPVSASGGLTWSLTKRPGALGDGLVYRVRTSTNLRTWVDAGAAGGGSVIVSDTPTALTVRLPFSGGVRHMRLDVEIPALLSGAAPPPMASATAPSGPLVGVGFSQVLRRP